MRSHTSELGRADLHIHTSASDGVPTVREVLDYVANHTHLDVIAITDHDRVDAALWACEHQHEYPFDIVPGIEVSSAIGHILGLWVTQAIPAGLSLNETVAAIHEQGGIAILAHPYHIHMGIVARNVMRYTLNPTVLSDSGIDAIETHNAGMILPGCNTLARRLVEKLTVAATGSSDAHTLGGIGSGVTRFPGHTAPDLRRAIAQAQSIAEGKAWPLIDYWTYSTSSTHNRSSEFLAERLPSNHPTHP